MLFSDAHPDFAVLPVAFSSSPSHEFISRAPAEAAQHFVPDAENSFHGFTGHQTEILTTAPRLTQHRVHILESITPDFPSPPAR